MTTKTTKKDPTPEEMKRCWRLRVASKTGQFMSIDEQKFMTNFYNTWPNYYPSDEEIFEATKPIGGQ